MDQVKHFLSTATTFISSLPPTTVAAIVTSILALFLLKIIFRRRNWSNSPPGPIGWPILGNLSIPYRSSSRRFFKLSKVHGPIYSLKMGQKAAIVVSSPEITKEILKHQDTTFSSRTITEVVRCLTYDAKSLVFVPYGARWRLLRKILTTKLFSTRALELFQPAREQQVNRLLLSLYSASKTKTKVNIADATFVVAANLISYLVCSKNLFDPTKKEGREVKQMGLKMDENGRLDMLDVFLDYKSDKKDDELKEFSRVDIKSMLSGRMTEILRKPEVYKKILAELDEVVGKDRFVEESDLSKLTYFQSSSCKRNLQTTPSMRFSCAKTCNSFFVNVWGIARDEKVWPEPYEFKPERFLGSELDVKGQHFEILPFGTGRRSCVASLLHAFEWDFSADILQDMTEKVGITLQKAKGLSGVPKPRLSLSVYQ
ncbi:hypothetical protein MKW92_050222 [Papaver armeniacum]|nr:hypothetical protein MKW92_050222 [Papaver armeniacum]